MKSKEIIIEADYRTSGKTNCITQLVINGQDYFVRIAALPLKKIVITKEISDKIQEDWENGNAVNLNAGSFTEGKEGILTGPITGTEPEEIEMIH
jgi:hypothetical protein